MRAVPDDLAAALAAGDVDLVLAPPRPRDVSGPGSTSATCSTSGSCARCRGHPPPPAA
ncbi:MAG: hypothetical protein HS111_35630 [Kofleriaceae bacterium]|nr:hypothetical protein [Kofleriaceae bacterium]